MASEQEATLKCDLTVAATAPAVANDDGNHNAAGSLHDDAESVVSDLSTHAYRVGLRKDLLSALSSIQTPGSFASFGALPEQPPAHLFVNGVGDIAMPLDESQATQLIAKARQAPCGKGSSTIVDTTLQAPVIVPHDFVASFFYPKNRSTYYPSPVKNLRELIQFFARACLLPQPPESSIDALQKLCEEAWDVNSKIMHSSHGPSLDGECLYDVLRVAVQLRQSAFFEKVSARHEGLLPLNFFVWIREWLGNSDGDVDGRFKSIQKGMSSAILSYSHLTNQFKAIATFAPIPDGALIPEAVLTPDYVLDWVRGILRSCVDACASKTLTHDDGSAMVDLALYFNDPSVFLSQVMDQISRRLDTTAFYLGFMARLQHHGTNGTLPIDRSTQFYQTIARSYINSMNFVQMHGKNPDRATIAKRVCFPPGQVRSTESRAAVSHEALAGFFSSIMEMSTEADDLFTPLLSNLAGAVHLLPSAEFHILWLPFVDALALSLTSHPEPLIASRYQQLFSTVLKAYVNNYVGREPNEDRNLARGRVNCCCSDCGLLNAFLTNAAERVGCFAMNQKRRTHLQGELEIAGIDCAYETWRSGSPQTLVVTKTFRRNQQLRKEWAHRRSQAVEQLGRYKQGQLTMLLGSDYQTILDMEHLFAVRPLRASAATEPSTSMILVPLATTNQPDVPLRGGGSLGLPGVPVSGVKRKLSNTENEVIDLTSD